MTRDAAVKQRQASVDQRQMQRMAHQIVDQHGSPRDPQAFIDKLHDLALATGGARTNCSSPHQSFRREKAVPKRRRLPRDFLLPGLDHSRGSDGREPGRAVSPAVEFHAVRISRPTLRGTSPAPAATSSSDSVRTFLSRTTRAISASVVRIPPNRRLMSRRSESDAATSAGVPASVSSHSAVTTLFIGEKLARRGRGPRICAMPHPQRRPKIERPSGLTLLPILLRGAVCCTGRHSNRSR